MKKEIKDFPEFNKKRIHKLTKFMGHYESSDKRKVHNTECLHKDLGEISP